MLCPQLKGSINLALCLGVDEVVLTKQGYQFSLSTPDRVFHFSSDSKQLIQAACLGQKHQVAERCFDARLLKSSQYKVRSHHIFCPTRARLRLGWRFSATFVPLTSGTAPAARRRGGTARAWPVPPPPPSRSRIPTSTCPTATAGRNSRTNRTQPEFLLPGRRMVFYYPAS